MALVALLGAQRDAGGAQRLHHVEVVEFVGKREGEHREVAEGALRLDGDDLCGVWPVGGRRIVEGALADDVVVGVEHRVDALHG